MKITFAGLKTTGKVDTVWAVINVGPTLDGYYNNQYYCDYLIVWGRRGGKLQTTMKYSYPKIHFTPSTEWNPQWIKAHQLCGNDNSLKYKVYNMIQSGYMPIQLTDIKYEDVYPEFENDLSKLSIWEVLKR